MSDEGTICNEDVCIRDRANASPVFSSEEFLKGKFLMAPGNRSDHCASYYS